MNADARYTLMNETRSTFDRKALVDVWMFVVMGIAFPGMRALSRVGSPSDPLSCPSQTTFLCVINQKPVPF